MKFLFTVIISILFYQIGFCQNSCPVIPLPAYSEKGSGTFLLNRNTPVIADKSLKPIAYFLQKELLRVKGIPLSRRSKTAAPAIILRLLDKPADVESYSITMDPGGITINAPVEACVFYGVISLLQLIGLAEHSGESLSLACWHIKDTPRYAWRGIMLDESMHFFGKEKVRSILDWMAFYKLNRFHWHLTDELVWRLEIKQYSRLSLVGGIGNYSNENAPAQFYTQEDIAKMVVLKK